MAEREGDFLSDNREGIFSTTGYIAIHFIGKGFGSMMKGALYEKKIKNSRLLICMGVICAIGLIVTHFFIPCELNSRRMVSEKM